MKPWYRKSRYGLRVGAGKRGLPYFDVYERNGGVNVGVRNVRKIRKAQDIGAYFDAKFSDWLRFGEFLSECSSVDDVLAKLRGEEFLFGFMYYELVEKKSDA